jgi:SNF2 family DNA or RNA helicase
MERQLWEHQKKAVEKAINRIQLAPLSPGFAFLAEVGTGKSAMAVHTLKHLCNQEKRIIPTLIFCPPVVIKNWAREIGMNSKIPPEKVVLLTGSGKKRIEKLVEAKRRFRNNFIAVTNYEGLQMADLFTEITTWIPGGVLICDEAHRLKNHQALRTKKMMLLADMAKFKYLLTGTPVLNNPMDLWAPFRIMDGGRTFGKNFFAFRNTYFYDKNAGMPKQSYFPKWTAKKATQERLGKMIDAVSFQARKSECLTLPPLIRERIEVALSKDQQKAYDEMLKEFITFVNDEACVAELAITKSLRLQQMISGFVRTEGGTDIPFKENPRLDALSDLLEDITESSKVIVWCNFKHNYKDIADLCDRLKLPYVRITGDETALQKDESAQAFEKDPLIKVCIANPQAGGEGINLVAADQMIYYTRDYSLGKDIQSEARNYRGGSERHFKVTRWDLVAPGTIDETVLKALENKQNVAQAILDFARK